jgi:non-ribosomal peptide synthetase component F
MGGCAVSTLSNVTSHTGVARAINHERSSPAGGWLCVHELFEHWVDCDPDAEALAWHGAAWSYGELERAANAIAARLRRVDVGVGSLVGVYCDRGAHLIAAVLGVLKAGAAFVPLDNSYPASRLRFMVDDAQLAAIVWGPGLRDRAAELTPRGDVFLVAAEQYPTDCCDRVWSPIHANDAAYVIYTSGSTGQPKGVKVLHRGVHNLAEANKRYIGTGPGVRVLQFSSPSFDAFVWSWHNRCVRGERWYCPTNARDFRGPQQRSSGSR